MDEAIKPTFSIELAGDENGFDNRNLYHNEVQKLKVVVIPIIQ